MILQLEAEHGTGRQARFFGRWSQLVHLLAMQLTARVSLRECLGSLKARPPPCAPHPP